MNKIAIQVQQVFEDRFGDAPDHLIRAPGRVNLIGEHTDYSEGFVMPLALENAVWIALRPRADQRVVLHSLDFGETADLNLLEPQKHEKGWQEYLKGIIWVLQDEGWELTGWEGVMSGDVPLGAGLSSSAALGMSCLRAFTEVSEILWKPQTVAKLAQRAEIEWIGISCGIMDQLISACGVAGHVLFIDCRNLKIQSVKFPEEIRIIILDTKIRRSLIDSLYNERHSQCMQAANILGKPVLRDANLTELEDQSSNLNTLLYLRARHVISENIRVQQAVEAIGNNDLNYLGQLMRESHTSLRDNFEVSNSNLDTMVECSLSTPGCLGARMTGAGFGGCAVAIVKKEHEENFINLVRNCYRKKSGLDPEIISCIPSDGVSRLAPMT